VNGVRKRALTGENVHDSGTLAAIGAKECVLSRTPEVEIHD
jgi:hypothetical protein